MTEPLTKGELKRLRVQVPGSGNVMLEKALATIEALEKERDELRAEVERLRDPNTIQVPRETWEHMEKDLDAKAEGHEDEEYVSAGEEWARRALAAEAALTSAQGRVAGLLAEVERLQRYAEKADARLDKSLTAVMSAQLDTLTDRSIVAQTETIEALRSRLALAEEILGWANEHLGMLGSWNEQYARWSEGSPERRRTEGLPEGRRKEARDDGQ